MPDDEMVPIAHRAPTATSLDWTADDVVFDTEPRWLRERSCCCSSQPLFRIRLPATGDRKHAVDLLLCGHHYQASRERLASKGARVFDRTGSLLASGG